MQGTSFSLALYGGHNCIVRKNSTSNNWNVLSLIIIPLEWNISLGHCTSLPHHHNLCKIEMKVQTFYTCRKKSDSGLIMQQCSFFILSAYFFESHGCKGFCWQPNKARSNWIREFLCIFSFGMNYFSAESPPKVKTTNNTTLQNLMTCTRLNPADNE